MDFNEWNSIPHVNAEAGRYRSIYSLQRKEFKIFWLERYWLGCAIDQDRPASVYRRRCNYFPQLPVHLRFREQAVKLDAASYLMLRQLTY
jgi:hypothetical protein